MVSAETRHEHRSYSIIRIDSEGETKYESEKKEKTIYNHNTRFRINTRISNNSHVSAIQIHKDKRFRMWLR